MKKILVITYYWPPGGGAGVQRWLKFVKYLPQFGWNPIVVVPENPEYPVIDHSLKNDIPPEAEIIELPIWEPYGIFKKITGRQREEKVNAGLYFDERKQSLTVKISLWIRGNFLIPDPRIFWVNPTFRRLKKIIPEINPDVIVTTGPPHSIHLIGLKLKKKFNLPWIADLRDPWSTIDSLEKFYPTKYAVKRQKRLEKKVLVNTDRIITVSPGWSKELEQLVTKEIDYIPNGFDEDDLIEPTVKETEMFVISHLGMLNVYRNNNYFWEALNELCEESEDFKNRLQLRFFGIHDKSFDFHLFQYENLRGKYMISGYIPHSEVKK